MTLLEKYFGNQPSSIAEEIAFGIFSDITDRKGLSNELDNIDSDIQNEMLNTWLKLIIVKLEEIEAATVEGVKEKINAIQYNSMSYGCGLEDRNITNRYAACEYGFNNAIDEVIEILE